MWIWANKSIKMRELSLYSQPLQTQSKIVNNKIVVMEMYQHATRTDSAEQATEKICRLATTKNDLERGWRV